jgi:hypothetical protein
MSTYVTVVKWSQPMTDAENQSMLEYIDKQSVNNGVPTTYNNAYARSWVDLDAANAFVTFDKTLQAVQTTPTSVTVYTIE